MTEIDNPSEERLRDRLVSLTRDLVLIPTCVTQPREMERGIEFICNHLEGLKKINIQRFQCEESPSLLALPDGIEIPEVLLCGHLDVIAHEDLRDYRSSLSEGRIYGPGSGDMKGQLAILLELFHSFHSRYEGLSLGILITSDEEQGGTRGARYLFEDVGLRCGVAILPDGGSLDEITIEEKGFVHLEIRSESHSGHAAWPWLTRNPLERLWLPHIHLPVHQMDRPHLLHGLHLKQDYLLIPL